MLRKAIWIGGALAFTCSYSMALAAAPVYIPDDLPHELLLIVSGLAACMVGGAGAILIFDRVKAKD